MHNKFFTSNINNVVNVEKQGIILSPTENNFENNGGIELEYLSGMISCKSTFNAPKTLQVEQNKNAIYKEIISNPVQLTNFISEAQKNEELAGVAKEIRDRLQKVIEQL